MALRTSDFHYELPEELIASRPLPERSASRMMVNHRETGQIEHRMFRDFPEYLRPDDLLVLNDTKVIPARLFSDDGKIELLCLDRLSPREWRCLVKPGRKMREGKTVTVGGTRGSVVEVFDNGDRLIRWESAVDLDAHGHLALPHYMGRGDEIADKERYQTVFAREEGAIAYVTHYPCINCAKILAAAGIRDECQRWQRRDNRDHPAGLHADWRGRGSAHGPDPRRPGRHFRIGRCPANQSRPGRCNCCAGPPARA
jgi:hypothetical protein